MSPDRIVMPSGPTLPWDHGTSTVFGASGFVVSVVVRVVVTVDVVVVGVVEKKHEVFR